MKRISLDIFRIGKTKDERKTRFEQSNEDRVNMNFKRLQQAIEEVNTEKAESGDTYTKAEADTLLSAKANSADVVPKSGGTFTGDVAFDGVLDITQRRCYATLSSAGWYRIIQYNAIANNDALGLNGRIFDIRIVRRYAQTNNEVHKITLLNPYNSFRFVDESSASNNNLITKIRATYNSTTHVMYIDVYYNASSTNNIAAFFDMYSAMEVSQSRCVSVAFDAVADAPSGETVLTTYDFNANYYPGSASTLNYTVLAEW